MKNTINKFTDRAHDQWQKREGSLTLYIIIGVYIREVKKLEF